MKINNLLKIIKFTLFDVSRSRWIFIYGVILLLLTQLLFNFSEDPEKTIVSLLNLALILNPIISLIFSTVYLYNSREFIELLLSQPLKRSEIFTGLYLGISITLSGIFILGVGIPFLVNSRALLDVLSLLLLSGVFLTFIYTAIALGISHYFDDKAAGLGVSIVLWLFFAILYDGILLLGTYMFSDYPLELPMIISSIFNPIDLGHISVMLKLDIAALLGYTGAVFEKFFGSSTGIIVSISGMTAWIIIPYWISFRIFKKKNF
jgi:Cu-processing system permease protein